MEQRSIKHIINEIQLVLAEKRTALSLMRTGIAIFALPLSVLTVLVATSRYYNIFDILGLFIPLLVVCLGLAVFGIAMMFRSVSNIRRYDRMVESLLNQSEYLKSLLGEAQVLEEEQARKSKSSTGG